MNKQQKEKGFTIIEVVLVLAIAGLIFLMVFLALPALQRNQRDTQRKADMSRLQTAMTSFASNNRNGIPGTTTTWPQFITAYLTVNGDSFVDPAGPATSQPANTTTYVMTSSTSPITTTTFTAGQNIIYYSTGYICGATGDLVTNTGAGARKVAFRMVLEGGGFYCINN